MDKSKQLMDPMDLGEEELHGGIEELDAKEFEPITRLPKYIPPRKPTTKVPKYPNNVKFMVSTLLLPENVLFQGPLLGQILNLKMEDFYHVKFPQLAPSKYLKEVYYEDVSITCLELVNWVVGFGGTGFLNMLWVLHFSRTNITTICVCQLLMLVHNGCL